MNNDLISREALKKEVKTKLTSGEYYPHHFIKLIDDAPTVPQVTVFAETADEKAVADLKAELQSVIEPRPQSNQIAWEQGYECGYHQAKEDIAKSIKEQYNKHHELIPYWLSIGEVRNEHRADT